MRMPANLLRPAALAASLVLVATLGACDKPGATGPTATGATLLQSVVPAGGSTDVDPAGPVSVTFDHPMNPAMSGYVSLHEGDVTGPAVAGAWTWSEDGTSLTFTPEQALKLATTYTIHLGGGLRDLEDRPVDCETYGLGMGGEWAWDTMWGDGGFAGGGGMMGGGYGTGPHMGDGWRHANGSYGMVFTFTTAG